MSDEIEPRTHHYRFAHRLMPALFFDDPLRFVRASVTDGTGFSRRLWDACADELWNEGLAPVGLRVVVVDRPPVRGVVFVLPEPVAPTEAYFVFAVIRAADAILGDPRIEERRYFTLEMAYGQGESGPGTCLCEWKEDAHLNFGGGCAPDVEAFITQCLGRLGLAH